LNKEENEGTARQPSASGRPEKHLARSLEDVSYLFLSEKAAEAPSTDEQRRGSSGQACPNAGDRSPLIVLDRSPVLQRDSLVSTLNAHTGVLEEGLRAIDANVPLGTDAPIDLLAIDRLNHLSIIDLDLSGADELLLRGICHFDWMVRNVPILRRMYHGRVIDFSAQPRVFLIAPRFSPMFLCAAQRIASPQIRCFLYQVVAVPDGAGMLVTCIPPS
jgi:hypothetical protein